jgi:3-phosphoshikimate 1-carboxyvinyltransferase
MEAKTPAAASTILPFDMSDVTLTPFSQPAHATIAPPGSKSLTNRALVLAALGDGASQLSNVLFADDTLVMLDGLAKLGFNLEIDQAARTVKVHGRGGKIGAESAELFCGNSGTTIRFLSALCSLGHGTFTLDGVPRMRQRPIGALTGMLKNLGVRTEHSPEAEGFPPIRILADGLPGGIIQYGSEVSSQYLSAILMIAPYARNEVRVDLIGEQTSWPYVAMTMQLMDHFGVTPELIRDPSTGKPRQIIVPTGPYAATNYTVEPDASNATYFLAAAAIRPGAKTTVEGLGKASLQGDVGFADVLRKMGAGLVFGKDFITVMGAEKLEGIDVDLRDMPDTAQTLAVVALFARGETVIRGLHTLRVKETDRLAALSNELQKFGAKVTIEGNDTLVIDPPEHLRHAAVDTYDDHRMAMSFAVAGTRIEHVTIKDAQCVNKTYPDFFADLEKLREAAAPKG